MPNPFRGEGTITLSDGKPRLLRFNANSIIALQEVLGLDLGEIPALAAQSGTQKLLLIRAFLWAGLAAHKDGRQIRLYLDHRRPELGTQHVTHVFGALAVTVHRAEDGQQRDYQRE